MFVLCPFSTDILVLWHCVHLLLIFLSSDTVSISYWYSCPLTLCPFSTDMLVLCPFSTDMLVLCVHFLLICLSSVSIFYWYACRLCPFSTDMLVLCPFPTGILHCVVHSWTRPWSDCTQRTTTRWRPSWPWMCPAAWWPFSCWSAWASTSRPEGVIWWVPISSSLTGTPTTCSFPPMMHWGLWLVRFFWFFCHFFGGVIVC